MPTLTVIPELWVIVTQLQVLTHSSLACLSKVSAVVCLRGGKDGLVVKDLFALVGDPD